VATLKRAFFYAPFFSRTIPLPLLPPFSRLLHPLILPDPVCRGLIHLFAPLKSRGFLLHAESFPSILSSLALSCYFRSRTVIPLPRGCQGSTPPPPMRTEVVYRPFLQDLCPGFFFPLPPPRKVVSTVTFPSRRKKKRLWSPVSTHLSPPLQFPPPPPFLSDFSPILLLERVSFIKTYSVSLFVGLPSQGKERSPPTFPSIEGRRRLPLSSESQRVSSVLSLLRNEYPLPCPRSDFFLPFLLILLQASPSIEAPAFSSRSELSPNWLPPPPQLI